LPERRAEEEGLEEEREGYGWRERERERNRVRGDREDVMLCAI
jgi:hypothetical protein